MREYINYMCNLTDKKARKSQAYPPRALAMALLPWLIALSLGGCQIYDDLLIQNALKDHGAWWFRGDSFSHLVVPRLHNPGSASIHIYIEGDGRPWIDRQYISLDPTPNNPLALRLMMRDPQNSIYLGRPCYFASYDTDPYNPAKNSRCEPKLWTNGRYSKAVVDSMVAAVEAIVEIHSFTEVALIGYSGGGTLAYLMAGRTRVVDQLVTVAANLDHAAWTDYHGYSPLTESMNPAETDIPNAIRQLHLWGGRDSNLPDPAVKNFRLGEKAILLEFPDYDHVCCWEKDWSTIVATTITSPQQDDEVLPLKTHPLKPNAVKPARHGSL